MLSNFAPAHVRKAVKPKAVLLRVDLGHKSTLQIFHLRQVDAALEDRLLDALSDPFTNPGHSTKSTPSFLRVGSYVIANDN